MGISSGKKKQTENINNDVHTNEYIEDCKDNSNIEAIECMNKRSLEVIKEKSNFAKTFHKYVYPLNIAEFFEYQKQIEKNDLLIYPEIDIFNNIKRTDIMYNIIHKYSPSLSKAVIDKWLDMKCDTPGLIRQRYYILLNVQINENFNDI